MTGTPGVEQGQGEQVSGVQGAGWVVDWENCLWVGVRGHYADGRETQSGAVQNLALTEDAKSRILYSMSIVSELHDINRRVQSLEKLALELRGYL